MAFEFSAEDPYVHRFYGPDASGKDPQGKAGAGQAGSGHSEMAPRGGRSLHPFPGGETATRVYRDSFETTLIRQGRRAKIFIGKPEERVSEDLPNPIEVALSLQAKRRQHSSLSSLARAEGMTPARASQLLALLRLPAKILDSVRNLSGRRRGARISERELRPIAVLRKPGAQLKAYKQLIARKRLKR